MHPALLLLAVLWGAGSLYFFAPGMSELIQINHGMTEVLTKGNTALHSNQTAPVQIHVGGRLMAALFRSAWPFHFFRRNYFWRKVF